MGRLVSLFTSEDIRTSRDEGILVQISPLFTHQPWNLAQDFSCSNTMCLGDTTITMNSLMAVFVLLHAALAPHSSTLAWKILRTEEPGRLQSMGLLRVCRDGGAWWAAVYGVAESDTTEVTAAAAVPPRTHCLVRGRYSKFVG